MNDRDNSAALFIAAVVVGLPMLGILMFSRSIGAEFWITGRAVGWSVAFLVAAGGAAYFLRPPVWPTLSGLLCLLWPCWWKVLDSIAAGGIDPENSSLSFMRDDRFLPWYAGDLFKYGVEAGLVALFAYCLYRAYQDSRY